MYQRSYTRITDISIIQNFIETHNFGIVISENPMKVTHLPLLLETNDDQLMLTGHFAKSNDHWKFAEGEVLIIFNGPHGYISPRNYTKADVPTWNYSTAHLRGNLTLVENHDEHWDIIKKLVDRYETDKQAWSIDNLEVSSIHNQIKATVSFRVEIREIDCKFKLSQNRPEEDRHRVIQQLKEEKFYRLAEFMEEYAFLNS